jgi:hypothetical protein
MDQNNLSDAPVMSQKDIMITNIRKECKKILEKYFDGREYDENKVNLWKEYALEEVNSFLKSNYADFGFLILLFVMKLGKARIDDGQIQRNDTDSAFTEKIQTKTMWVAMTIQFYKLYKAEKNHIENIEESIFLKMNDIITNKLENEKFSYDIINIKSNEIVDDMNNFLLDRKIKKKPCSYLACYIMEKPMNFKFDYKIINLKYMPLMVSYSNNSLYARLILFIFNN